MHDCCVPAVTVQDAMSEAEKSTDINHNPIPQTENQIQQSNTQSELSSTSLTDFVERSLDYFCSTPS